MFRCYVKIRELARWILSSGPFKQNKNTVKNSMILEGVTVLICIWLFPVGEEIDIPSIEDLRGWF